MPMIGRTFSRLVVNLLPRRIYWQAERCAIVTLAIMQIRNGESVEVGWERKQMIEALNSR